MASTTGAHGLRRDAAPYGGAAPPEGPGGRLPRRRRLTALVAVAACAIAPVLLAAPARWDVGTGASGRSLEIVGTVPGSSAAGRSGSRGTEASAGSLVLDALAQGLRETGHDAPRIARAGAGLERAMAAVPAPATLGLVCAGTLALAALRRSRSASRDRPRDARGNGPENG